jgi:hypothetical protein
LHRILINSFETKDARRPETVKRACQSLETAFLFYPFLRALHLKEQISPQEILPGSFVHFITVEKKENRFVVISLTCQPCLSL